MVKKQQLDEHTHLIQQIIEFKKDPEFRRQIKLFIKATTK